MKVEATAGVESERQRQKQMRKSEKIISQELNESAKSESFNTSLLANLSLESIMSDHENVELDIEWSVAGEKTRAKKAKEGKDKVLIMKLSRLEKPQMLTGATLLHIIYCALNICGSNLQLSDLIRFVREGHLSFFKLRQFLPDDITEQDVPLSFQQYHSYRMINYEYTRRLLSYFVRLIPDLTSSFRTPNLVNLARRHIDELNLPNDLNDYVERLMIFLPPVMKFKNYAPNYEGRAMAYVLFVLKLLFGIDGYREKEISESARRVNKKAKPKQTIFVYEDWRKFIEYRQTILGKFYYPTLLFQHNVADDCSYLAFNAMLESLNPKTTLLESNVVNVRNEKRMQSKSNATEMLANLAKTHESSKYTRFSFHVSLTPLKDNFQHILENESSVKINRKVAEVNYSTHSLEAFLSPQKLVNEVEVELEVKKATFPRCFAFLKPSPCEKVIGREVFEAQIDEVTTRQWRCDLKQRQELEKEIKETSTKEFHQSQLKKVLAKRKLWRQLIRNKKLFGAVTGSEDEIDGPKHFNESNVLSESEDEGEDDDDINSVVDSDLERLFQEHELTFVVPDFNMWQQVITLVAADPRKSESQLEKLPNSFRWLLNLAASVLHQHPLSIYQQLLCIEHQFLQLHQPVELMQNVLLKQKNVRGVFHAVKNRTFEETW